MLSNQRPTVLLFSALDPGAKAGLAADLEVCARMGASPRIALTALTAQSDGVWVGAWPTPPEILRQVLRGLELPERGLAFKTGMLASSALAELVLETRRMHTSAPLVVDPLWRSTSGGCMWPLDSETDVLCLMRDRLLPVATAVTPNWLELAWLVGMAQLERLEDAERALRLLPCPAVLKGGHAPAPWLGIDWVWDGTRLTSLAAQAHWQGNVRGTGCRFATALAIGLGRGEGLFEAARTAKEVVAAHALERAQGHQPL